MRLLALRQLVDFVKLANSRIFFAVLDLVHNMGGEVVLVRQRLPRPRGARLTASTGDDVHAVLLVFTIFSGRALGPRCG